MSAKTSGGLVDHAMALLGSPYMWGTYGKVITDSLIERKAKQYPAHYGQAYIQKLRGYVGSGARAVDCVGLIKAYMMTDAPGGEPVYRAAYDKNVAGMRGACASLTKLSASAVPEIPGLLLFVSEAHVGIYLGGGEVIEAAGGDRVKITGLRQSKWTDWGKLRWIIYSPVAQTQSPVAQTPAAASESAPTAPQSRPFVNTGSADLAVYADTALRQRVGTLPKGNGCAALGEVNGKTLLLYRISGTKDYKAGFVTSDVKEPLPSNV